MVILRLNQVIKVKHYKIENQIELNIYMGEQKKSNITHTDTQTSINTINY